MGFFDRIFGGTSRQEPAAEPAPEPSLFTIEPAITHKAWGQGFESLTPPERVFFCIWELEAEVNNGGFSQYYFNSAGDTALHVPGALRAIGAEHTAALVDEANAAFGPSGPPCDRDERQAMLERFDTATLEHLDELDSAFYEYQDNLSALLTAHMRANGLLPAGV